MFKTITRTWNPFTGCRFDCAYCWARQRVEGRLHHLARYKGGFMPTTHPDRFNAHFKASEFVFTADLGDIAFAPAAAIHAIVEAIHKYPETKFLVQSKDPGVFANFYRHEPNVYLGTTLETTQRDGYGRFSSAPSPWFRYQELQRYSGHKFISIEPIMDFDVDVMITWLRELHPDIVEVGADNYHNNLPEPSWEKVQQLLEALRGFVPQVLEKDGLERLQK